MKKLKNWLEGGMHKEQNGGLEILKYIGPGLLVTVGFIDPGNWASNVVAGADYGYALLWMVTLSTIMLIILQHNAAHLGIVTGLCMAESATKYLPKWLGRFALLTGLMATTATILAEILGGAIALSMLFSIPVKLGSVLMTAVSMGLLLTNSYRKLERWIIGFVSLIGLAFLIEILMVKVDWPEAARAWVVPSVPTGSMPVIMSVLGAVVMPHNLFLHSEVIQSRQWNVQEEAVIRKQLKYEFLDTLLSMGIGWAINSAMLIVAASTFFQAGEQVSELEQAAKMLTPLIGPSASVIFAVALLMAGISSSVTAGMAGGSITARIFEEPYDIRDRHSRLGIIVLFLLSLAIIFFIKDPFTGLVYSQMFLSMQLPITIILLVYLTSSKKVMGKFANSRLDLFLLVLIGVTVIGLNICLLVTGF